MNFFNENDTIYLLENNEKICYAKLDENNIVSFYVKPNMRYISYGKSLLLHCIEVLKLRGYSELYVNTNDIGFSNLLKKEGFVLENDRYVYKDLDKTLNKQKSVFNVSLFSFILNLFLSIAKLFVGITFNISCIIADGINSSSDCITNFLVVVGSKISNSEENEKYPFGYGKIESIFSLLIGFIMVVSSVVAIIDSIDNINKKIYYDNRYIVYFFTVLFIFLKVIQYLYVRYTAIKYDNLLLKTLIKDYLSDILLSTFVLIGTILSISISKNIDIVLSTLINLYIVYQGAIIVVQNTKSLLDAQNRSLLDKVKSILYQDSNIHYIHDIYMLSSNHNIYIYADVRVDGNLTVTVSHELVEKISLKVRKEIPKIKRVTLHVEPIY